MPQRLVPARGMVTVRAALLECPHASTGGDWQLSKQLGELAGKLGGTFIPDMVCGSIGQCIAAVESRIFAAVLPAQIKPSSSGKDYVVVEDDSLDSLMREIASAWHPRTADLTGPIGSKLRQSLITALRQQSARYQ
jgi:hypothetical protein